MTETGDTAGDDRQFLCRLDDIADGESAAAQMARGEKRWPLMLIRQGDRVYGYVNSCPHIGAPLDWKPGQFLTRDRSQIICAIHGARFVIEDGSCVAGPCYGRGLSAVALTIEDGAIYCEAATGSA